MAPVVAPECYFAASGCAAILNYPLWKASAIAQSGFIDSGGVSGRGSLLRFLATKLQKVPAPQSLPVFRTAHTLIS